MKLKEFYEHEAEQKRFVPGQDRLEETRVRLIFDLVPRLKERVVIDIGCGDGYLCSMFKKKGFTKVRGVDFSSKRIEWARNNFTNIDFRESDIYHLPERDNTFELVTCVEVLEHLERPEEAFKELLRVSSKYVILAVPYKENVSTIFCPHCENTFYPSGHMQSFNLDRLQEMAETSSAKIVKKTRIIPLFLYRRFRLFPVFRWMLWDWFKDTGYIGVLVEKKR